MPKAAVQREIPADQHDGAAQGHFMRMSKKKGDFFSGPLLIPIQRNTRREKGERKRGLLEKGAEICWCLFAENKYPFMML